MKILVTENRIDVHSERLKTISTSTDKLMVNKDLS